MTEELKDSVIVTVLAVIGFVFGIISMMGSFIPCIGSLAFLIGIPAALISVISVIIARTKKAKSTFAVVSLTICLIGVFVSGFQYFSIISLGKTAEKNIEHKSQPIKSIQKTQDEDVMPAKVYSPSQNKKSLDNK